MRYVASVGETWTYKTNKNYNSKKEEIGIYFREKNHITWIRPVFICLATNLIKRDFVARMIIQLSTIDFLYVIPQKNKNKIKSCHSFFRSFRSIFSYHPTQWNLHSRFQSS